MSEVAFKQERIIDANALSFRTKRKKDAWLRFLQKIPNGKAYKTTPKELGTSAANLRSLVRKYERERKLHGYYVSQHKSASGIQIFIVHKEEAEQVAVARY